MGVDMSESGPPAEPPEHPLVASAQRASQTPVAATVALTGLFGRADEPEKRRVYLSAQLNQYAEFRAEDVVRYDDVSAADSPIAGHAATRVTLKRGSPVAFTHNWTESLNADDQFDLDVRVATGVLPSWAWPHTPAVRTMEDTRFRCVVRATETIGCRG
jgi:hypothetical protein